MSPKKLLSSVEGCFEGALKQANAKASDVISVGITNQRESLVIWDGLSGEPLHPIILWLDTRTIDTVSTLEKKLGSKDALRSITGLPISTYFTGVKLKWIMDNVPNVKDAIINGRAKVGMH
jgi:glycerol kinase